MEKLQALPQRYENAQNVFKSVGAELKELYITLGKNDWVGIVEAPDEEAMAKALLDIARTGMSRSHTMTAIPIAKALDIIKQLP